MRYWFLLIMLSMLLASGCNNDSLGKKFARYKNRKALQGSTFKSWQYLIPRYGAWGGPGWSANKWSNSPEETKWEYSVWNDQDACYKRHDWKYQHSDIYNRGTADRMLCNELHQTRVTGLGSNIYKGLAITVFSVRATFKRGGYLRRDKSIADIPVPDNFVIAEAAESSKAGE